MAGPDSEELSGTLHQRSSLYFRSVPGAAAGRRGQPGTRKAEWVGGHRRTPTGADESQSPPLT